MAKHLRYVSSGREAAKRAHHAAAISRMLLPHHTVEDQFEVRYEACAKIFHAVFRDPDIDASRSWNDEQTDDERDEMLGPIADLLREDSVLSRAGTGGADLARLERVLWRDLLGTPPTADTDWRQLGTAFNGPSWPRQIIGPDEGQPDRLTTSALLAHLERTFGIDTAAWMFLEAWEARSVQAPDEGVLAKGSIRSIIQFIEEAAWPRSWWDTRGRWALATDRDSCASVIGSSAGFIGQLHQDPKLEIISVNPSDILFSDCTCQFGDGG